jgi:hypothetical protein
MTGRARLFTLMARAEAMRLAQTGRAMTQAQTELARAEAMDNRLRHLLDALPRAAGPVSVASLRDTGLMLTQLAAEAADHAAAASAARLRVADLRVSMAGHDQRRRRGEEAAQAARRTEAEQAEAKQDAARPTFRPN